MKKALVVALVLVLGLSASVLANSIFVGNLVVNDYVNRWTWKVPNISIELGPCERSQKPQSFYVTVSNLQCGQNAHLYVMIEGNQLIYLTRITRNGRKLITLPSNYNNGYFKCGWQCISLVLSTTPRFDLEHQRRPQTLSSWNFIGYPCSGYVVTAQKAFYVGSCCCCCCCCCCCYYPCCSCRCP
jgi:hypothetical protein